MSKLAAIAPIIWAKWDALFLEALRRESLDAADGLAFRALNSEGGIRTLLIVCTTNRAQIHALEETLGLHAVARPADWESYSAAEMIFKSEKGSGLGHQEPRNRFAANDRVYRRGPSRGMVWVGNRLRRARAGVHGFAAQRRH